MSLLLSAEQHATIEPALLDWFQAQMARYEALRQPAPEPKANGLSPEARRALREGNTALLIWQTLMSHRFCRQRPVNVEPMQAVIQHAVESQTPIPLICGHGPLKNPNNTPYQLVDWAEWATFAQLAAMQRAVQQWHPPGLAVSLYVDDARSHRANSVPLSWTRAYIESLRQLVAISPLCTFIKEIVSFEETAYPDWQVKAFEAQACREVQAWEADPANADELELLRRNAMRNAVPGDEAVDPQKAAHAYRVWLKAEELSGLWSQPDVLYGRFSPHVGYWQLFTLRRGSVTQPWQGQGGVMLAQACETTVKTAQKHGQLQLKAQHPLHALLGNDVADSHQWMQALAEAVPSFQQLSVWTPQ